MHVVFIVHDAASSGAVINVTRRQAEFLARSGERVTLVSDRRPGTAWQGVDIIHASRRTPAGALRRFAARLVAHSGRIRTPGGWAPFDLRRVAEQRAAARAFQRMLPHIHARQAIDLCVCCQHPMALALSRFRKVSGVRFALVSHGDVFSHPLTAFSLPLRWFYRRAAVRAYRLADRVCSVSRALERVALAHGCDAERSSCCPNGVDPYEIGWPPVRAGTRNRTFRLLCVGRLAPEKGHAFAVAAMQWLRDIDVELVIVGEGPCGTQLRAMAERLRVADRCVFTGAVARGELGSQYACADLLIQPSVSDGMPLAVIESFVCGVPVVASAVGGIPELITQGVEGVLVPPSSDRHLADAVRSVLGEPGRLAAMKQLAAEAGRKYRWEPLLEAWKKELAKALGSQAQA